MAVTTAELTHTMYNVGYRFEAAGKSVVVSGDTSYRRTAGDLAKGADMLVMDGDERWAGDPGTRWPRSTALESQYRPAGKYGGDFYVPSSRDLEEIAQMASAAEVKHLV